jgi:hypothetical protein
MTTRRACPPGSNPNWPDLKMLFIIDKFSIGSKGQQDIIWPTFIVVSHREGVY